MLDTVSDKRSAVLKAAFDVFITYGFRKTSMDDIARAAGVSRPALYQQFRNKSDIFRALASDVMRDAAGKAEASFATGRPFRDRLFAAIDASILDFHRVIAATPHGTELMGVNEEIAGDLEASWCDTMIGVIARALEQADRDGEIDLGRAGLDAVAVARIFMQAMEGMKRDFLRGNAIEGHVVNLVTFYANTLDNG